MRKEYYIVNRDILDNGFVKVTVSDERITEQWLEVNGQLSRVIGVNARPQRITLPSIVDEFPPEQIITSLSLSTQQKIYNLSVEQIRLNDVANSGIEEKITEFRNQLSIAGYPFDLERLKLLVERRTTHHPENFNIAAIPHFLVYYLDGPYYALVSSHEAWSYRRIKKFWSDYRTMIISASIGLVFFLLSLWIIDNNLAGDSWEVASLYGLTASVFTQIALVFNIFSTFPGVLKHLIGIRQ